MKRNILAGIISLLLAAGVGGYGYKVIQDRDANIFENSVHQVVAVIDGDTIDIENDVRIRLLGIDAPERDACFADEATEELRKLLTGAHIRIEKDISGADRYDRLLRYVYISADDPNEDDVFVNEKLVRDGFAKAYGEAPDNRYRDLLASAQEDAKQNKRGLWGACKQPEEESNRERDSEPEDPSCTIKGNISEKAYGRQYFTPGCPNYKRIKVDTRKGEAYFCSEEEAVAAGFTRSESCDNSF